MRPAVDLTRLAEFSDGTAAGLRSLVGIFLADVAETIDELTAAVDAGASADVERLAHRAGGASAACGAAHLAALLLSLEDLTRGGRGAGTMTLMRDVAGELERVTVCLRTHLEEVAEDP